MVKHRRAVRARLKKDDRLFTLEVHLLSGPVTEEFVQKNKVICRTIQIRGDQTLDELHYAIFDAFDREDPHLYEFQLGGKGPLDPKARRYVHPMALDGDFDDDKPAGTVEATIGSLGLKKDDVFGYWFDFGDDWWHQVNVMDIKEKAARGRYPKVVKRVGQSPPQYVDWDEEE